MSWLYALNTLGAMTGTLLAGYILIPAIGIQRSFLLAAALNVIVGVAALLLDGSRTVRQSNRQSSRSAICRLISNQRITQI